MLVPSSLKSILAATCLACASTAVAASNFGCTGLNEISDLPSLEGKDGVIFRINADLRMYHPFSPETVSVLGELSRALAAQGTTLIYVPIPTKSVTMPQYLPPEAALYGFDLDVATWVHTDMLDRLSAEGVQTVDVREAMLTAQPDAPAFFKADFHWSAAGANLAAEAIANTIKALPGYADLDQTEYETTALVPEVAFSGMRRVLQKHCRDALPAPETMTYQTTALEAFDLGEGGLDLFGEEESSLPVALLGTSFSDSPINNFPGFLAQHAALEVVNYAITGGNQFGAMTSYLTSTEFAETRPRFLVWENPIYNNLAQFGDQPMRELIAAAWGQCTQPVAATISEDGKTLSAAFADLALGPQHTLFVDGDATGALRVNFEFSNADGALRTKVVTRGKRLRRTSRFYMPMTGLWPEGASAVDIHFSEPLGSASKLFVCPPIQKARS